MDSNKFETLLNRFEGHVVAAENSNGPKTPEQLMTRFESLIMRLEGCKNGGGPV
jgi:hypothetical protein